MHRDALITAYRTMRLIRSFEELVIGLVNRNEIAGVTHEYIGQEAVATGVCEHLGPHDVLTSTHRGHGHLLARGASPSAMFAELLGRTTGLNRGRGGSMHIADVALGIYGANGIVGGGAPFALGAASVPAPDGTDRIAVAFFGDGALNQGVLLECMNLASVWKLPVIFCCENNGYAVTMASGKSTAGTPLQRAQGFAIPGADVDGMDVEAVSAAAALAADWVRGGNGPYFLNAVCYRYAGHHTAESTMKLTYRTTSEIDQWKARDPLVTAGRSWLSAGGSQNQLDWVDSEVEVTLAEALLAARDGDVPEPNTAMDYLYSTPTAARWGA